ncbi:MAG TPA: Wzz/FepE/Etk N-terminal domain-containing protein [Dongiaceae bacterium]|nr:Wzz/FepE/Etk N-terminal domain-containing protein [Dongiaceae bacterium]
MVDAKKQHLLPSRRELLNSAFKDARRIVLAIAFVLLAAIAAAAIKTPLYTAHATLLVLLSPEYAARPDAGSAASANMALERDAILNSEISILTSTSLAKDVVRQVGLARLYPKIAQGPGLLRQVLNKVLGRTDTVDPVDLAADQFSRDLAATPDKSGSTIDIAFRHQDNAVAAAVVNDLVAAYQRKRQDIYADVQSDLVAGKAAQARQDLESKSAELAAYQSETGVSDFPTQLDILLRQQGDLQRQIQQTDTDIADASERLKIAQSQLTTTPAEIVQYADSDTDRRIQDARDTLNTLKQREYDLRQTYTDKSDKVITVQKQIAAMQDELAKLQQSAQPSAVRKGRNDVYSTIELDRVKAESSIAAAQQQRLQLQSQLAAVSASVGQLYGKKARLDDLTRQKTLAEQAYSTAMKTLSERQMVEDVGAKRATNVRVIEAAEPPLKPAPIRLVILAGGLILSLIVGFLTAFLSDFLRRSYISSERLEKSLGIPVLVTVSASRSARPILALAAPDGRGSAS